MFRMLGIRHPMCVGLTATDYGRATKFAGDGVKLVLEIWLSEARS